MSTPTPTPKRAAGSAASVKRFHFWILSGKGRHVGRFPIADSIEPDEYCELHYDDKGVCVLVREFIQGYAQPLVRKPTFDAQGRMKQSDRDGPDAETKLRNTYEYGPDGLLKARQETERATGQLRWRVLSKYDANGWAQEQQRFEADGKESQRSVFEVDAEGFFTKETKYAAGVLLGHYVFRRDAQHREVGREWHSAAGRIMTTCTTAYGEHDLPREMQLRNPDGSTHIATFTYDPRGKCVSLQVKDAKGKLLEEHRTLPDGGLWKRSLVPPPQSLPKNTGALGVAVHQFERLSDEQAGAMIAAGCAHFQQANYIEALPMFQIAAARYPTDAYFPYAMGLCSLKLGRYEAAIVYYGQALALDPNHEPSLQGMELAKDALPYLQVRVATDE
jgi:hypothetical protein